MPTNSTGQDPQYAAFLSTYPGYAETSRVDELRAREYPRLDASEHIYLDYTGGGLYAESQLQRHQELLRAHVFGNPHSSNPASLDATHFVEHARRVRPELLPRRSG